MIRRVRGEVNVGHVRVAEQVTPHRHVIGVVGEGACAEHVHARVVLR